MLPYYIGTDGNYIKPSGDTTVPNVALPSYDLFYYSLPSDMRDYSVLTGLLGKYASYEEEYRAFVHDVYLSLDAETRAYMNKIIVAEEFDPSDPRVIGKVASYIQQAAVYNLDFDPALEWEENIAIAFLETYKEGVCRHYATAATLLFRALGFPARYVEGFAVKTQEGSYVEIKSPGHAWVEVYLDGIGWIYVEVTGGGPGGSGGGGSGDSGDFGDELKLTLTPAYQSKIYDGTPLYAQNFLEVSPELEFLEEQGYSYTVLIEGVQLEVGIGKSYIVDFRLYDPSGTDVTGQFSISYNDGELQVYPKGVKMIRLWLYECSAIYQGKPIRITEDDYEILEIEDGLDLYLDFNISLTDVGYISVDDINANLSDYVTYRGYRDGADVTEEYILYFDTLSSDNEYYYPLKVTERTIEITAGSAEKVFDETPLTYDSWRITMGSLAKGHRMEVAIEGSITEVGEAENYIVDVRIYDEKGHDVTENYAITGISGTLTVLES